MTTQRRKATPDLRTYLDQFRRMGTGRAEEREARNQRYREVLREYGFDADLDLTPCDRPQPWDQYPEVCKNCGAQVGDHVAPPARVQREVKPYEQALFTWFVKHGGVNGYYGGYKPLETAAIRRHLLSECAIDVQASELPEPEEFSQFGGTDADSEVIDGVAAQITCTCRMIDNMQWGIKEPLTLGQMIFQVVREGQQH